MATKKASQLDREIDEVLARPPPKTLGEYLQLANHVALWAGPKNARVHPALRPYMTRVPKRGADRQFWLGEVLNDLRQAAQHYLTPAEMKRLKYVMDLITASPPSGYRPV